MPLVTDHSDAEVASILGNHGHQRAVMSLTDFSQSRGRFEDGGFGRLKCGDEYYRFNVYRRVGRNRASMPLIQNERDWHVVAEAMCNLANNILKNDVIKRPKDILPILMKFHTLDGNLSLTANGNDVFKERANAAFFDTLHKVLQRVYTKFRPEELPPAIGRGSQQLVDPSHSKGQPKGGVNFEPEHTDSVSDHTEAESVSSSHPRRTGQFTPITTLIPKRGTSSQILSPRGSHRSTLSPQFRDQPYPYFEAEVSHGLHPRYEATCEYALEDFDAFNERSQQFQETGIVPRCTSLLPRNIFQSYLDHKLGLNQAALIPLYYSSDGKKPEKVLWVAMCKLPSSRFQMFLPFEESAIDLRKLYFVHEDKNKVTMYQNPLSENEKIVPLYATGPAKFEEELSFERAIVFLHQKVTQRLKSDESILGSIYEGADKDNIGNIFAHGNPCIEDLRQWVMQERMLPLISAEADPFPFEVRRRADQVPLEVLERRHLTHMRERISILRTAKEEESGKYKRKTYIIPIHVKKHHWLSRNEINTHYISLYQEDDGDVHLRIPDYLAGKNFSVSQFQVLEPNGSSMSLLEYLQLIDENLTAENIAADTSPIRGQGSLHEIQASYEAIRDRMQLANKMEDNQIDEAIRQTYTAEKEVLV